ncbi:MAG: hypothetical protein ABI693_20725 [Bryobacteraceae bacterium]
MAQTASQVRGKLVSLLGGPAGLPLQIGQLATATGVALAPIPLEQVMAQCVALEMAERAGKIAYPIVYVYATRIENQLKEKFRTFSGIVEVTTEVRVTNEHLNDLERDLQLYLEAITGVLDENRGNWGGGMFYSGKYTVTMAAAKSGGRNFVQTAKVICEVDMSIK